MMSISRILMLSTVVLMLGLNTQAQTREGEILSALNSMIRPVETLNPDSSFSDLKFLDEVVATKNVIGLGEVTHGTAEVFAYKDRMIRYLVSNHQFRAIGFESDFMAVEHLDNYINHVADTIKVTGGFPLGETTRVMLLWLRTYNSTQAAANRVHLYGLEARGFNSIAAKILATAPELSAAGKTILQEFAQTNYYALKKQDISQLKDLFPLLRAQQRIHHVSPAIYMHYIDLLSEAVEHFETGSSARRDHAMAKNANWIIEQQDNKKLIVWAHNGHVSKAPLFRNKKMGQYLAEAHNYYVIATDFSEGDVLVTVKDQQGMRLKPVYYPKADQGKAYEYYFEQLKYENFFLEINRSVQLPILKSLFEHPLNMHMIGATPTPAYVKLAMSEHFDLIIFIKKSTSA
jgi:erythromycin esterase-like protein